MFTEKRKASGDMKRVMINRARYRKIKLSLALAMRTSPVTSKTAGSAVGGGGVWSRGK